MNRYTHRDFALSTATTRRRTWGVPIPSGAWVKTLQMPPGATSQTASNSEFLAPLKIIRPPRIDLAHSVRRSGLPRDDDHNLAQRRSPNPFQRDELLGVVAVLAMFVVLAWAVTGIDLFAAVAIVIAAAAFITAAIANSAPRRPILSKPGRDPNGHGTRAALEGKVRCGR